MSLAAACDLRLCSPASRFGVPIARTLGNCLSAANHARFLDLLGPARLKDLLFSARLFDAAEALAVGFVNRIVEAPLLDGAVRRLAHTIAAECAPDDYGDEGNDSTHSAPPTFAPRPGEGPHRHVLHERRLQGRRRCVPEQTTARMVGDLGMLRTHSRHLWAHRALTSPAHPQPG